jgi:hypothetical protein
MWDKGLNLQYVLDIVSTYVFEFDRWCLSFSFTWAPWKMSILWNLIDVLRTAISANQISILYYRYFLFKILCIKYMFLMHKTCFRLSFNEPFIKLKDERLRTSFYDLHVECYTSTYDIGMKSYFMKQNKRDRDDIICRKWGC